MFNNIISPKAYDKQINRGMVPFYTAKKQAILNIINQIIVNVDSFVYDIDYPLFTHILPKSEYYSMIYNIIDCVRYDGWSVEWNVNEAVLKVKMFQQFRENNGYASNRINKANHNYGIFNYITPVYDKVLQVINKYGLIDLFNNIIRHINSIINANNVRMSYKFELREFIEAGLGTYENINYMLNCVSICYNRLGWTTYLDEHNFKIMYANLISRNIEYFDGIF